MRFSFILSILGLALSSTLGAQKVWATDFSKADSVGNLEQEFICYDEKKLSRPYSICYREQKYTNSEDIVYFFHDMNSSEKIWFTAASDMPQVQRIWDREGYRPRIVSISFGRQKVLIKNIATPEHNFFLKEALPFIESEYGGLRNGKRHIMGQAMGAISAINLSLRKDVSFNTVSLLCPSLSDLNPFASERFIQDFASKRNLNLGRLQELIRLQKENYLSAGDWNNNNPNLLLSKFGTKQRPKIYVSAGGDSYGFRYGTESFLTQAKSLGFSPKWEPVNGAHCSFRAASFAKFIMEESRL